MHTHGTHAQIWFTPWFTPRNAGADKDHLLDGRATLQGRENHVWSTDGKRLHNYGKSPFLMGESTINGHFQ